MFDNNASGLLRAACDFILGNFVELLITFLRKKLQGWRKCSCPLMQYAAETNYFGLHT
jgi:hypothetical protein